jgi:hypothetical protein
MRKNCSPAPDYIWFQIEDGDHDTRVWRQGDNPWMVERDGFVMAEINIVTTRAKREDYSGIKKWRLVRMHQATISMRTLGMDQPYYPMTREPWPYYGPLGKALRQIAKIVLSDRAWAEVEWTAERRARAAGATEREIAYAKYDISGYREDTAESTARRMIRLANQVVSQERVTA